MERETTGLYLTGHPMDEYRELARRAGAAPIGAILSDFAAEGDVHRFRDNQRITVAGVVTGSKTRTTKSNTLMTYIQLEDDSGSMELIAFQKALDQGGGYIRDNAPLLIDGRISVRDEKEPQLMVDSIRPLDAASLQPARESAPPREAQQPRRLWVRLPSRDCPEMHHIELVLQMFPGQEQLVLYFEDTGKRVGARCLIHEAFVQELREVAGDGNVVVK